MRGFRVLQAISAAILIAGMGAAVYLCVDLLDRQQSELRQTTEADADHIANRLQTGILRNFEPLNQLAAFWLTQDRPLVKEDWDSDTHLFLGRTPGILQVAWVGTNGFVGWWAVPGAAPHTGRLPVEPGAAEAIQAAERLEAMALSTPVEGADGLEIYAATPILKGTTRRGYIVGRYNVASLLAPSVKGELRPGDSLVVKSGGSPLYVSDQIGRSPTSSAESNLRVQNLNWTMSLEISRSYFREFRGAIATVAGVIGALLYSAVLLMFLWHRRSSQMERANAALQDEMELRRRTESAMVNLNLELRRKVADFETLLDVIPIGIAVADDPACRSIRTNPALARMMGVPRSLNISKTGPDAGRLPYRILRNGQEVPPGELAMQMAAATRAAVLGDENQIVKADGSTVDVLNFASPLFDEEGNVRGVLNACVDISERKAREQVRRELEQRLQRAERRKSLGVMAAGIAHDFNNLLTSIIGQASLAAARLPQGHPARQNLDSSLEAAQGAAALIQQVLAYTGQAHHALVETSLPRVVEELRTRLAELATGTADLHFHIAESAAHRDGQCRPDPPYARTPGPQRHRGYGAEKEPRHRFDRSHRGPVRAGARRHRNGIARRLVLARPVRPHRSQGPGRGHACRDRRTGFRSVFQHQVRRARHGSFRGARNHARSPGRRPPALSSERRHFRGTVLPRGPEPRRSYRRRSKSGLEQLTYWIILV